MVVCLHNQNENAHLHQHQQHSRKPKANNPFSVTLILLGHLHTSGMWLGVAPLMDTKYTCI